MSRTWAEVISMRLICRTQDRKSTRLNSSHDQISYAVFCLKKKRAHSAPPPTRTPRRPPAAARRVPAPAHTDERPQPPRGACILAKGEHRATVFFFNDTATTEIYTLSLHDALPISWLRTVHPRRRPDVAPHQAWDTH